MDTVFLVVVLLNGSGNGLFYSYLPQQSMSECEARLKSAVVEIAKGGDAEQGIAIFCSESKKESS